ncbi:MAG: 30S ribosomal protein S3, partial [Candidatus Methanomethylophilaceae archaeon]
FITRGFAVAKLKMGVIGVTVEIMDRDSKLPADISVASKTEAAELLPDMFRAEQTQAAEPVEKSVEKEAV